MNSRLYKNAKGDRSSSDHRRANPRSGTRRQRIRDSKKFKTVEREHDPLRRFGSCIKVNYIDSDGDGYKDLIIRKTRLTSVGSSKYSVSSTPPASNAPANGPTGISVTAPPANGPTGISVTAPPANGPTGVSAAIAQFNIAPISTNQDALVATTPAPAAGTIKYSKDSQALFIYDGTDWQHYKSDG